MDTPGAPERDALPALYGDGCGSINRGFATTRRAALGGAIAFGATASGKTAARGRTAPSAPLIRAIAALGGARAVSRVASIGWIGATEITTPERTLRLGVETHVEPFLRARTESWIAGQPKAPRTLVIEANGGWMERDGQRLPLPPAQARHEREQYGLYGYMLMRAPTAGIGNRLHAARAGLPPVRFDLAPDGGLVGADYTVFAPDGGEVIQQRFSFDGVVADKGLRWPRRLRIAQDGIPFFTLVIDRLMVEFA